MVEERVSLSGCEHANGVQEPSPDVLLVRHKADQQTATDKQTIISSSGLHRTFDVVTDSQISFL